MRAPVADEEVQVCIHLASADGKLEEHWWDVPGRPWIVLCDACHGQYQARGSVEIHGEVFQVPTGIRLDPNSSCATHSVPLRRIDEG